MNLTGRNLPQALPLPLCAEALLLPRAIGPADSIPAKPGHGNVDRGEGEGRSAGRHARRCLGTHIG